MVGTWKILEAQDHTDQKDKKKCKHMFFGSIRNIGMSVYPNNTKKQDLIAA